jgi:hypothetical protein
LPPTSQPLHVSEELILPSPAVLASARRNVTPVRYEPLITVYDETVSGIGTYSQDYSLKFIQFLQENEIICNNDTTIKYLEFCLKYMFKEDFKKNVVNCIFFRGIVFDKMVKVDGSISYMVYLERWKMLSRINIINLHPGINTFIPG